MADTNFRHTLIESLLFYIVGSIISKRGLPDKGDLFFLSLESCW